MSLSDEERRAIVMYRIEKAQTALADIHKILPLGMWSIIANRLYYALYYAASALLIHTRHKVSTHKGVIALFNLYYIKDGLLPKEDGVLFANIFAFGKEATTTTFSTPPKKTSNDTSLRLKPSLER